MYESYPTPAVIVELGIVEKNIKTLVDNAKAHGIAHRPHVKTHRSSELAHLQLKLGAQGITCAKLGEAEVMARSGIQDIFIAYPLIGEDKMERLGKLMQIATVTTLVGSAVGAKQLSDLAVRTGKTIRVRLDIDGGLGRGGVLPGEPALALAQQIQSLPGLQIVGLMYYGGLIYHEPTRAQMEKIAQKEHDDLVDTAALLRAHGFIMDELSGGTSFSGKMPEILEGITEIRSGHYIFNDCSQLFSGFAGEEDCALRIVTTLVAKMDERHGILDVGTKTLTSDLCDHHPGYGYILGRPQLRITALNEEHAFLESEGPMDLEIGDKVTLIPNHACVICNLAGQVYGVREGRFDHVIQIDAQSQSV